MSTETVRVMNTQTGQTGTVPRRVFEHPVLSGGHLVEVTHDTKPFAADLYRPRSVEEFTDTYPDRVASTEPDTHLETDYDPEDTE